MNADQPIGSSVEAQPATLPLVFTATGGEYFGIWIVNLVLSILTLGIYSAWAKVRRLQYFYRNTALGGSSFDYHGQPLAILKGRIVALVLFSSYSIAGKISPPLGIAVAVLLATVMPWLLLRSLRFRLHNSSLRGLRFSFRATTREAYKVFLLFPLLTAFTLYLMGPFWHQRLKQFQHNNAWFGETSFQFKVPVGAFYKLWLKTLGLLMLGAFLIGVGGAILFQLFQSAPLPLNATPQAKVGMVVVAVFGMFLLLSIFVGPYATARLQNLIWNGTTLGPHRFVSNISARKLFFISLTNFFGVLLTLGFYHPFAMVRLLRYKIQSITLVADGDLDDFVAGQARDVGAAGEEAAEMFDIDIAL
jgi:uncharacterized membrane protein YjgN (DUF898 family)